MSRFDISKDFTYMINDTSVSLYLDDIFTNDKHEASVTIMADFSPEFDPPARWRSKHQTKNDC